MTELEVLAWARRGIQEERRRQEKARKKAASSKSTAPSAEKLRELLQHNVEELDALLDEVDKRERHAQEMDVFSEQLAALAGISRKDSKA